MNGINWCFILGYARSSFYLVYIMKAEHIGLADLLDTCHEWHGNI